MAHLNVPSTPQAAIFSPSVARAAASTAKDWAYVDGWLRAKYALLKRRPPPFERNPDTLRALLALAAANETADEERDQLARVEDAALAEVRAAAAAAEEAEAEARARAQAQSQRRRRGKKDHNDDDDENADDNIQEGEEEEEKEAADQTPKQPISGALLASDLLHAFDDALTRDGRTALDAMSDVAIELGIAPQARTVSSSSSPSSPAAATDTAFATTTLTPESLGRRFVELQGAAYEVDQAAHRVDMLRRYLESESARADAFLAELCLLDADPTASDHDPSSSSSSSAPAPADLARQNLETQRRVRAALARLPELRQQVTALGRAVGAPPLTVDDVRRDEEAYLGLLARKRDLDARVRAFAGLPPDVAAARAELDALRAELRRATERRDADFESLVERESPVKARKGGRA